MSDREDCKSCDNLLDQVTRLSSENAELRSKLEKGSKQIDGLLFAAHEAARTEQDLLLQAREAGKLLNEFTTNRTVCQALGPTCVGGHGEDPCKCLYCRTRHQLSLMD